MLIRVEIMREKVYHLVTLCEASLTEGNVSCLERWKSLCGSITIPFFFVWLTYRILTLNEWPVSHLCSSWHSFWKLDEDLKKTDDYTSLHTILSCPSVSAPLWPPHSLHPRNHYSKTISRPLPSFYSSLVILPLHSSRWATSTSLHLLWFVYPQIAAFSRLCCYAVVLVSVVFSLF